MARRGKADEDGTGKARRGLAWRMWTGLDWRGEEWHGTARRGKADKQQNRKETR